ncbi:hypothetical protein CCHR01_04101 [Colletotrichum chrysophilum]|nr:hypothetical protein CCHR01_04101 [Colletotrichum chrysophilum]
MVILTPHLIDPDAPIANCCTGRRPQSSVSYTPRKPRPATDRKPPSKPKRSFCLTCCDLKSYPKHVWSPAGGWYAQPANWKLNTAIIGTVMLGTVAVIWRISAEKEVRYVMPRENSFFPSRYWSKQLIEYDREQAAKKEKESAQSQAVQNS